MVSKNIFFVIFSFYFSIFLLYSESDSQNNHDSLQLSNFQEVKMKKRFLLINGECEVDYENDTYLLKDGYLLEFNSKKNKEIKLFKNIKIDFIKNCEIGAFDLINIKFPFKPYSDPVANIKIFNNKEEVIWEYQLKVINTKRDENFYYFRLFIPYSLFWKDNKVYCEITFDIKKKLKGLLIYKNKINSKSYDNQKIRFNPSKSKYIINADRNKYLIEQEERLKLWKTVSSPYDGEIFSPPLSNRSIVTSTFGLTREWILSDGKVNNRDTHLGIDYYQPAGTDVFSAMSGKVVSAKNVEYYGNMVIIDHGYGLFSNYCHLDTIVVKEGDLVKSGDLIAKVGNSGLATGPHLHFEFRIYAIPVDPKLVEDIFKK